MVLVLEPRVILRSTYKHDSGNYVDNSGGSYDDNIYASVDKAIDNGKGVMDEFKQDVMYWVNGPGWQNTPRRRPRRGVKKFEAQRMSVWKNFLGRNESDYSNAELKRRLDNELPKISIGYTGNDVFDRDSDENVELSEHRDHVLDQIYTTLELN